MFIMRWQFVYIRDGNFMFIRDGNFVSVRVLCGVINFEWRW